MEVQEGVEARLVEHPDVGSSDQYVLCRSQARSAKERAMLERQMNGLTEELAKIDRGLRQRDAFDLEKVGHCIGRWQGRYPAAARLLDVKVLKDEKGNAVGLELSCALEKGSQVDLSKGAYLLQLSGKGSGAAVEMVYPVDAGGSGVSDGQE